MGNENSQETDFHYHSDYQQEQQEPKEQQEHNHEYKHEREHKYTYLSVSDIPDGTSPPSIQALIDESKKVSLYYLSKYDPTEETLCQASLKSRPLSPSQVEEANHILSILGSYSSKDPPFSEKTFYFMSKDEDDEFLSAQPAHLPPPVLYITSVLNSDRTISYWLCFPNRLVYNKIALLKIMNLPLTAENLETIGYRFKGLLHQAQTEMLRYNAKCEQLDPLFIDLIVRSLLARNYGYDKKKN